MKARATIGEWVREAYASENDCPPPEMFLPEELERLNAEDRRRLESHVEQCSACAAEHDLAAVFEIPADLSARERRAVERIATRLKPHRTGLGLLERLGLTSINSLLRAPAFQLAAAAALILVVGFGIRTAAPPELGEVPTDRVVRGSTLRALAPVGELEEVPTDLSWEPVDGAVQYLVTVRGVDDEILGQVTTETTRLSMDSLLGMSPRRAVTYVWSVEAQGSEGAPLAWSSATRFRVRPQAEEGTE